MTVTGDRNLCIDTELGMTATWRGR